MKIFNYQYSKIIGTLCQQFQYVVGSNSFLRHKLYVKLDHVKYKTFVEQESWCNTPVCGR